MATAPKRKANEPAAASSSQDLVNDQASGRRQEQKVYTFNNEPKQATAAKDDKTKPQKTILEEHGIILGKVIGTGNYAKVKIGFSEEYNKRVAVKIISKVKAPTEYTQKFLPREIEAVKGLHHENLITFYQSIETSHRVYLIMQLAENGTLLDYVREKKFLDEPQARTLFRQLISAVEYIHSKNVVHRDIKCENLLLDENWNLKLIDFGFARKDTKTSDNQVVLSKTFCGSYAYASPEILKGKALHTILLCLMSGLVVWSAMLWSSVVYPTMVPMFTSC
ncbi:testis-specific serine/threonine-protein kinase 1 isoform X2 [Scaptodrosophila lebanonensis]|uniref:Testis-specific serine/threonine-protein kinase 1 isoform X2 n=1 Tax=Drosophila lebanonensis TaxID=7225 RepID=A0A6J2TQ99_DROLE|nr:testis-specific serine/threonine-protein kinase 1 isoform X2 [Scaptodrosophila lebanonensis]